MQYPRWLFVLSMTIGSVAAQSCQVTIDGSQPQDGSHYTAVVDPSCSAGVIRWMYPTGVLWVSFQQIQQSFTLCLRGGIGPFSQAVYHFTDTGPEQITSPTPDALTCVDAKDGKAIIKFEEPLFTTFQTVYEFSIVQ
ncbi:uncharacterized protein LOC124283611 [Haliotis rubra]|uniref:uncharacterized protein LOC124283611 n=1 Tax=Haliotis rubra TaxID=36100 RepID=UPI001EE4F0E6|nr:uncharacterized protein LOC124283611 [Haliotis rubra]